MRLPFSLKKDKKALTVLVVDDKKDVTEMLATSFKYSGFKTIRAHSGKEALKTLHAKRVNLIISDIKMPEMNGLDLGKCVRTLPKNADTPIFFVSGAGYTQESMHIITEKIPRSTCYEKPLNLSQLIVDIKKAANRV